MANKREPIPRALREHILGRDAYTCTHCGITEDVLRLTTFGLPERERHLHIDHAVPVVMGGTNVPWNLFASCPSCNRRRPKYEYDLLLVLAGSIVESIPEFSYQGVA